MYSQGAIRYKVMKHVTNECGKQYIKERLDKEKIERIVREINPELDVIYTDLNENTNLDEMFEGVNNENYYGLYMLWPQDKVVISATQLGKIDNEFSIKCDKMWIKLTEMAYDKTKLTICEIIPARRSTTKNGIEEILNDCEIFDRNLGVFILIKRV